jgi:hypothetical protein
MIKRNSISILLLFASFLAQSAFAQTASITGTIKDSSGGLVPQAQITAKNKATNASRRNFAGRSVPAMARIQSQDRPDMGSCPVAGQLRGLNAVKG